MGSSAFWRHLSVQAEDTLALGCPQPVTKHRGLARAHCLLLDTRLIYKAIATPRLPHGLAKTPLDPYALRLLLNPLPFASPFTGVRPTLQSALSVSLSLTLFLLPPLYPAWINFLLVSSHLSICFSEDLNKHNGQSLTHGYFYLLKHSKSVKIYKACTSSFMN